MDDLFGSISIDDFKKSYLDKNVLHVRGAPGKYAHLFSFAQMNALLRHQHLGNMQVSLVLGGQRIDPSKYYHGHDGRRRWKQGRSRINLSAFLDYVQKGATLHLTNLHEVCDTLADLNESLERVFHTNFEIVSFTSWGSTHGFPLHYSCDEVLILQIAGRKKWHVFQPTERSFRPIHQADQSYHDAMQLMDKAAQSGALDPERSQELKDIRSRVGWTGILEEGDLLYVPRGWPHQVFPLNEPSVHITCAFVPPTGIDLLELMTERLHGSALFRQQLPRFADSAAREQHMARLRDELLALWDDNFLDQLLRTYDRMNTPLPRYNLQWAGTEEVFSQAGETRLRWVPVMPTAIHLNHEDDELTIHALGETLNFNGDIATANRILEFMMSHQTTTLAGLLDEVSEDPSVRADVVGFVRQLILDGLVSVET